MINHLAHTEGGVFEDERLNALLRALTPAERQTVYAYAEDDSTTWTEAVAGAPDPEAFGERVRRKTKRLAAEQRRRGQQAHRPGRHPAWPRSCPTGHTRVPVPTDTKLRRSATLRRGTCGCPQVLP
ncbi:hypothetical protein QFZ22_000233 [Streptomyces canus]|uniref:Uncharacterized protein n=1 Tax=Streptomyces canus TaxID=58343 RepID=A0AAW8F465_9ACTN|nr:hypothetical protein [Streptomyces canus]MDQ0904248.1 hypothetical protein [Streptomyces canus]